MLTTTILALAITAPVDGFADDLLAVEDPRDAIDLVVDHVKRPDLRGELLRICARESGGGRGCGRGRFAVKVHERDSWAGRRVLERAIARGWIDPSCYSADELDPSRWSTRGPFGLIAAYSLRHLAPEFGSCVPPDLLDKAGPAALAAARLAISCRVVVVVDGQRRRVDACDCEDRTRLWVGSGVWDDRSYERRRWSLLMQCGPQPPLAWWQILADLASGLVQWGRAAVGWAT